MKIFVSPDRKDWPVLLKRPVFDHTDLIGKVGNVLQQVKQKGDAAVQQFTAEFDGARLKNSKVTPEEIATAVLPRELKDAIRLAAANIRRFHEKQVPKVEKAETIPGVKCWRKAVPIQKVGLYIPGGTAPLFSTILMLGIPAAIAGCEEVVLCSPPDKTGKLHPAILFAADLVGIHSMYKIGGAQAIGAMAYGTETVPAVYKIFGPGNQYVTCAKQMVQQDGIAIDMPAGPSEVCVLADDTARPEFVAADLLSQAEHGVDSQVLLVSTSKELINAVNEALRVQLPRLPRKEIAAKALENSKAIYVKTKKEAIELVNEYAAEHLIIACANDELVAGSIVNAGSVFLGNFSPESVGDYASGTNHTLPTNGYARAYSGVSLDSFLKKITYQRLTKIGLQHIGRSVEIMAEAEGLHAHKEAVSIRLKNEF
ncbi:MAG: histidinol dehydrogenase [Sphingobacteriia bacterium]|nr:histidinol dehydrogenase [Sphingobacteriia bacterium]